MQKLGITLLLSLLIFIGCKKENNLLNPLEKNNTAISSTPVDGFVPAIKNGRLVFPNTQTLGNYILSLQKMDEKTILGLNRGFISHWQVLNFENPYNYTEAQLNEEAAICDPFLASVLDKNREAQIGDFIYQAGNDYSYLFFEKDRSLITRFLVDAKSGVVNPDFNTVFMYKNLLCWKTGGFAHQAKIAENPIKTNERAITETDGFNNKKRMKSKFWETNWLVYASSGGKTKTQKKQWFIWNALNSTTVEVKFDVDLCSNLNGGQPLPFSLIKNVSGTVTKSNDDIAKVIFDAVTATIGITTNIQSGSTSPTGAGADLFFGVFNNSGHTSTTKHRAVWNGTTKNRTLSW